MSSVNNCTEFQENVTNNFITDAMSQIDRDECGSV